MPEFKITNRDKKLWLIPLLWAGVALVFLSLELLVSGGVVYAVEAGGGGQGGGGGEGGSEDPPGAQTSYEVIIKLQPVIDEIALLEGYKDQNTKFENDVKNGLYTQKASTQAQESLFTELRYHYELSKSEYDKAKKTLDNLHSALIIPDDEYELALSALNDYRDDKIQGEPKFYWQGPGIAKPADYYRNRRCMWDSTNPEQRTQMITNLNTPVVYRSENRLDKIKKTRVWSTDLYKTKK